MKHLWVILVTVAMALATTNASAKRMGGFSFGKQSGKVTQRQATPPSTPAAPAQGAAGAAGSRFGGMGGIVGGLAAGLGLAWLASSLGLGAEFGNILMIALLVMAGVFVFRMLSRPRMTPAGAGAGAGGPNVFRGYDSKNVGNDASARPWEAGNSGGNTGSVIGSGLLGNQMWGVPEGFDTVNFLNACKRNFTTLQAAWDASDVDSLRSMMTDEMVANIQEQLNERDAHSNGAPNVTEVLKLDAQLLGIEEIEGHYMASVEFNGLIRESADGGPTPFREVWNVTRPMSGPGGWVVAGVQALG